MRQILNLRAEGFLATLIAILLVLTACKYPPIFATIEQEVKLKPASVKGTIHNLVTVETDLYVFFGTSQLKTKKIDTTGEWHSIASPGGDLSGIASDGSHLYACLKDGGVKYYDSNEWKPVTTAKTIDVIYGQGKVFGTDTDKKLYIIETSGITDQSETLAKKSYLIGAAGNYAVSSTKVFKANSSGAPSAPIRACCKGSTNEELFVLTSDKVFHYNGTNWESAPHNSDNTLSITVINSKNLVLIGTERGYIQKKKGSSGWSTLMNIPFDNVASSIPTNAVAQYHGSSVGICAVAKMYALQNGDILYAGILDEKSTHSGLWGFYNPKQLEWNRE